MKETLILLTGTCRYDNLYASSKLTIKEIHKYNDVIDIYWLICLDSYNGSGNIELFEKSLIDNNIKYKICYSGKPNQSNFGGDLFNIPLSNFIHENNLDNSWIYILDDDNIIHPRLISSFIKCANNNFYGDKEIITFINKWDCGHNREIDDYMITYKSDKEPRLEWFLFDPSQVIIKYSIIQKYNGIGGGILYDFYWLNYPVIDEEFKNDNVIFYKDYDNGYGKHIVTSYHNGLIQLNKINNFNNKNADDICFDLLIQHNDIDTPLNIPILKKETKEKILQLIIKDYTDLYENYKND